MRLTPEERAKAFSRRFPKYGPYIVHNGRLYATWVIGSLHMKGNGYYGAFPYSVKERILATFPDCEKVTYLFSGTINDLGAITYDINSSLNPTICDDIRNIVNHKAELEETDLFIADPPYQHSDFEKYGQKPFDKRTIIQNIGKVAKPHSFLAWLDTIVPMYNKKYWALLGYVGVVVSTNTRMRCLTLLERTENPIE